MTAAGVWSQANVDGFGDTTNNEIDALAEFNGYLYAATTHGTAMTQIAAPATPTPANLAQRGREHVGECDAGRWVWRGGYLGHAFVTFNKHYNRYRRR